MLAYINVCFSIPSDSEVDAMTSKIIAEVEKLAVVLTLHRSILCYSHSREIVQFNDSIGAVAGEVTPHCPQQLFEGVGELFLTANSSNNIQVREIL